MSEDECGLDIMIETIKQLLSQTNDEEIRLGITNLESLGFDLSDENIVALFENGIYLDIVLRKTKSNDRLIGDKAEMLEEDVGELETRED